MCVFDGTGHMLKDLMRTCQFGFHDDELKATFIKNRSNDFHVFISGGSTIQSQYMGDEFDAASKK